MKRQKISIVHLQMVKDTEIPYGGMKLDNPEDEARKGFWVMSTENVL